jgi:hypothetical protein
MGAYKTKQLLAEGTEIVVKTMIDTVDKNAPAIAKAIFSLVNCPPLKRMGLPSQDGQRKS